jgi:hypothetical protein
VSQTAIFLWILALMALEVAAPEVDLVVVLGLPPLLRQAQGLLVRRDPLLGHVPLAARAASHPLLKNAP